MRIGEKRSGKNRRIGEKESGKNRRIGEKGSGKNRKKKGEGNARCGNKYLAWAFVEAANFAIRYEPLAKRYYERKKAKTSVVVARKAVAHKLARACYYMMRDQVPFSAERCFGGAEGARR